jgi:hypothetical protein
MASAKSVNHEKLIVDSVHGDVHLRPIERTVIDTASFQRLRQLKQLGMAHVTYPNATHTRFAHSIGVLGIMEHILRVAEETLGLGDEQEQDIRLAGLLHDVGHYPYSHLMEKIDKVQLTEEFIDGGQTINATVAKYPKHEEIGKLIVTTQNDLIDALGGIERAKRVAALFTRETTTDPQLSKLIHSSLDMDRLDYLMRDAQASGVPYGRIDLNYLLHNFRTSSSGMLGVDEKALTAVEHFLLARFFMHKTVYYHKTTYGIEEACRQLLRRVRDAKKFGIPSNGQEVRAKITGAQLGEFTDAFVDRIIESAALDEDPVISAIANCIRRRRPPRLLKEVNVLEQNGRAAHAGSMFRQSCKYHLRQLAEKHSLPLGRFLVCHTPPLTLEERGPLLTEAQARSMEREEREELIKVFVKDSEEPVSVVNIPHSVLHICSNHFFQSFRLYFVLTDNDSSKLVNELRQEVSQWGAA